MLNITSDFWIKKAASISSVNNFLKYFLRFLLLHLLNFIIQLLPGDHLIRRMYFETDEAILFCDLFYTNY